VASMMAAKFDACAVNPGLGWAHRGHTWAQTEAISRNDIRCHLAAHSRCCVLTRTGGSSFRAGQSVIRPLSSPVWALLMLSIDPKPLIKRGSNQEAARQRRERGPQGPGAGAARRAPDGHGHRGGLGCRQRPGHRPAREIKAPEPRKSVRINIPQIITYRTA
jgi:hypothetical protein